VDHDPAQTAHHAGASPGGHRRPWLPAGRYVTGKTCRPPDRLHLRPSAAADLLGLLRTLSTQNSLAPMTATNPDDIGPDGRVRLRCYMLSADTVWLSAGCEGPRPETQAGLLD
jgi:hypothetical protein